MEAKRISASEAANYRAADEKRQKEGGPVSGKREKTKAEDVSSAMQAARNALGLGMSSDPASQANKRKNAREAFGNLFINKEQGPDTQEKES